MTRADITIITPSYNQGEFIEETIKSVISQEGDFTLEYLIMDAGSTDATIGIIKKYDKLLKDGKWPLKCRGLDFKWVSGKDGGQADAINKGFAATRGRVLNWINSDDRLTPGALKSLMETVAAYPGSGVWAGSCNLVNPKGRVLTTVRPFGLTRDELASWGVTGFFFQPSCFFSREAWEKCGPLDLSLYIAFDLDLFLTLAAEYKIHGVDTLWSEATIHKDAKTTAREPLMNAEKYVVQARHGYERLAISNIEKAERAALLLEKPKRMLTSMLNMLRFRN